jgi:hypothetical protein
LFKKDKEIPGPAGYQEYTKISDSCQYQHFVHPLFQKITMCANAELPLPEGSAWTYLVTSASGELWIWSSSNHLLSIFIPFVYAAFGSNLGSISGKIFFLRKGR